MLTSLALSVLVLLFNFPRLGGLPKLPPLHLPQKAAVDTLPPAWKPASSLALQDQFVNAGMERLGPRTPLLRLTTDPRRLRVGFDPDSGTVSTVTTAGDLGDFALGRPARWPLRQYEQELFRANFERMWRDKTTQSMNSLGAGTGTTAAAPTGLSFKLPGVLPRRVQGWLGPGGPALNVSGSENIRLSGTSNWSNQQVGPLGQRRSLFPSLDMQQDLDIRLEGQLSDRVRVNLLQNSANQVPLANRIAINYKGEEDDVVQALDLGNTSLTLPGTQYVSYSGKNEGLFGVKATTRVGPLDFTILASKQEGRSERASYTGGGGASEQNQTLYDFDYIKGTYFLLYDPNGQTYDIPDESIRLFKDDAIYNNDVLNSLAGRAYVDPADTSSGKVQGVFTQLQQGAAKDYEILRNYYGPYWKVIRLTQSLSDRSDQVLAVTYQRRRAGTTDPLESVGGTFVRGEDADTTQYIQLQLLRPPAKVLTSTGELNPIFDPANPFTKVRELEMKNFYQLPGQRIDPTTLKILVRKGLDVPAVTTITLPDGTPVPYIEVLGLDDKDETSSSPTPGHDGKIDGSQLNSQTQASWVDYDSGVLFFPDLRPFAPRLGAGRPFEDLISAQLNRRIRLTGTSDSINTANPGIYDRYNPQRSQVAAYFFDVSLTSQRAAGEITLGRGNILEGSDVVTINGQALTRERDYTIDYDLGKVVLRKQLGPSDQLNVDYSYAPLFQQAGRTLLGSAFRLEGRDKSFGGAFMYESRGAQDLRPRLGEEPSRSLIGDLNTEWRFRPEWLTQLVDHLPGVRTTTPSEFHVQAEVGGSFPNPNTRNEVFVDDMEGVRDAISLSMGPERWRWSSVPSRAGSVVDGLALNARPMTDFEGAGHQHNAEIHWFSPPSSVKEHDLKPGLTDAEGGNNSRQVLALSIPRRPLTANNSASDPDTLWAGLTYPLDVAGIDLSKSQFIELWVNDFNDEHDPQNPAPRVRGLGVKLHVDLGVVSENQMRAPNLKPNAVLDTEDKGNPPDGQLTVVTSGDNPIDEDTGYDGLRDVPLKSNTAERDSFPLPLDLTTANPSDPAGDDFHSTDADFTEIDPRRYRFTNGTEGNKSVNPTPDTEDLNLNRILDQQENYFEYTINFADTTYLVDDVRRSFPQVSTDNGWRRYRIPISDSLRVQFGSPDLTLARHVRIWLDGVMRPDPDGDSLGDPKTHPVRPLLVLGSVDIVGSRWQAVDLDSLGRSRGETMTLNSVNSVDNADIYRPLPFDPGETRNGSQGLTRREQSLAMEFTELQPGDTLEAFKTFSIPEDYSRYGNLDWYAAAFDVQGYIAATDSLDYFVRFASDEQGRDFYEYRTRLPSSSQARAIDWRRVSLKLTDMSNHKLDPNFPRVDPILYQVPGANAGETYVIKGHPSFTRLRRISFGLINAHTDPSRVFHSGQLWFDEVRSTNIAKDQGRAQRVSVDGRIANLMSYNLGWSGRDADFLSVGETRGSGNVQNQFSANTSFDLHRFIEGTGVLLPVSFGYTGSSSKPRFTAGDDVVRLGALADASETKSESRSLGVSYQRAWSERANPFLLYTLGGITASWARSTANNSNPNSVGESSALSYAVNYGIAPRKLLSFGVPGTKTRFYPLAERMYWNYSISKVHNLSRERLRDSLGTLRTLTDTDGRSAGIDFGADHRPFDFLHHHVEAHRNLVLPEEARPEHFGAVNFGRVTSWRQNLDANTSINRGLWIRPAVTWTSQYSQNNGPELSRDLSLRSISNGQTGSLRWDFPFDQITARSVNVADSTRHPRPIAWWRGLVARLGPISTSASYNKASDFSLLQGAASPLYLLGITSDPHFATSDSSRGVRPVFGGSSRDNFNWDASGRTRLALGFGATVATDMRYGTRRTTTNGVTSRSISTTFPNLDVDYGRVASVIKLDKLLKNAQLRTTYNRLTGVDYSNNSLRPTGKTASSDWGPLIGLTGDLRGGTRTDLRIERRITKQENLLVGNSVSTDRSTNVRFSISRSYSSGQKVNLLGKESTVRSSVNLQLSTVYEKQSGETIQRDTDGRQVGGPQLPKSTDRLSIDGTGSYGFSNNVTGNMTLGFGQNRNLQTSSINRSVRVELRAQFTF